MHIVALQSNIYCARKQQPANVSVGWPSAKNYSRENYQFYSKYMYNKKQKRTNVLQWDVRSQRSRPTNLPMSVVHAQMVRLHVSRLSAGDLLWYLNVVHNVVISPKAIKHTCNRDTIENRDICLMIEHGWKNLWRIRRRFCCSRLSFCHIDY